MKGAQLDERMTLTGSADETMDVTVAAHGRSYRLEAIVRTPRGVRVSEPQWYPTLQGARDGQAVVVGDAESKGWVRAE